MKLATGFIFSSALVLALAISWGAGAVSNQAAAHEAGSEEAKTAYSYTAQPGDSYTEMARKAVQTYGMKHKINLSQAGIIYAETNLTLSAGSPILNNGQKVEIKESTVHEWADKAQKLTDAQKVAWNRYVQFVDFNTNKVGQPR